ncbi:hypothetical protein [Limnospira sp. Paracas R14]|nr:hypothetical protein [Limnospira sp. Paracas R14]
MIKGHSPSQTRRDRLIQPPRPFQLIRLSQQLTRTHSLTTPHN